ncbi:MAG: endolytic transglycosylase MltG [Nitrospirae bacterium]|nr:endolytic transglycosylase MltG [Nitrospirota bacterium]
MKKRFIGFSGAAFILFGFIILSGIIIYLHMTTPASTEDKWIEVFIPEGSTYSQGINILKRDGIINNRLTFLALGRLAGIERRLRAGYYNFNRNMTPFDVFDRLRKGMIIQYSITIPEGAMLEDIKLKLREVRMINDESWKLVTDKDFLSSLKIDAPSLEGYLFPDTYSFAKGTDPKDIFRMMVNRMRDQLSEPLMERAAKIGMSEKEVLTLASIIEKEAVINEERYIISAVYHNRLKKRMRLQADPTVVYGIKKISDGITRTDLKRDTPYNTYLNYGLPPGPIDSPGINSVRAALFPAAVDYLYFVSKNDGTHYFSSTGEEHMKAVEFYRNRGINIESEKEQKTN